MCACMCVAVRQRGGGWGALVLVLKAGELWLPGEEEGFVVLTPPRSTSSHLKSKDAQTPLKGSVANTCQSLMVPLLPSATQLEMVMEMTFFAYVRNARDAAVLLLGNTNHILALTLLKMHPCDRP